MPTNAAASPNGVDSTFTLLRRAASLYFRHPRLALIAAVGTPPLLALEVFSRTNWWLSSLGTIPLFIGWEFVLAALVFASSELLAGRGAGIVAVYRRVAIRCRTLVGVTLALFLGVVVVSATVVGLPFGVYLLVRWWFAPFAAVLNDVSVKEALRMSSRIVDGAWWRMFGRTVGLGALAGLPVAATGILVGRIESYAVWIPYAVAAFLLPLHSAFYALLFLNALDAKLSQTATSPEVGLSP